MKSFVSKFQKKLQGRNLHHSSSYQRQKQLLREGLTEKQTLLIQQETKRNDNLRFLKTHNGPFTCVEDVERFMGNNLSDKERQRHLKAEVVHCRDTTLSMQNDSPLFKIMTINGKSRRMKSAQEFAENLKVFFGKMCDQGNVDSLGLFRSALIKRVECRK